MKTNNDSRFDIDLAFGQEAEQYIAKMFGGKIEVKTERDLWKKTGNIAIEYKSRGKPSGISTTQAEQWVQVLSSKGKPLCYIGMETAILKKLARHYYDKGKTIRGGDDNTSELVLIPLQELFIVLSDVCE